MHCRDMVTIGGKELLPNLQAVPWNILENTIWPWRTYDDHMVTIISSHCLEFTFPWNSYILLVWRFCMQVWQCWRWSSHRLPTPPPPPPPQKKKPQTNPKPQTSTLHHLQLTPFSVSNSSGPWQIKVKCFRGYFFHPCRTHIGPTTSYMYDQNPSSSR